MTTSRFCYVLMCHTDAAAIVRLVRRVHELSPEAAIVVRHSVPDLVAPEAIAPFGATVHRSAIHIVWGDWSMTRAALEALEHARQSVEADHYVLLSGQDYPIRDLARWEDEVRRSGADALVDVYPPMTDDWYYRWWTVDPPHVGPVLARRAVKLAWRLVAGRCRSAVMFYRGRRDPRWILGVRRPELLRGDAPVVVLKGSLWLTLSGRAVDSLLRRHREDRRTRDFFRSVRIPDESYVQSLLLADTSLRIMDCPTTFARFRYDEWSPTWVDLDELALAARTPAAFVRKLPEGVDAAVLAEADLLASRPADAVPPIQDAVPGQAKLTGAEVAPGVPSLATGLPAPRG